MAVNECIPFYEAAYTQKITVHFDAAVSGKRFCGPLTQRQSGPGLAADPLTTGDGGNFRTAGPPAAAGQVGGVVMWDVATAAKGGIIRGGGTILPVSSGAAIALGAPLAVDTLGRVVTATVGQVVVGYARNAVAGADLDVQVEMTDIPGRALAP